VFLTITGHRAEQLDHPNNENDQDQQEKQS
jgi:hypothetical protein